MNLIVLMEEVESFVMFVDFKYNVLKIDKCINLIKLNCNFIEGMVRDIMERRENICYIVRIYI